MSISKSTKLMLLGAGELGKEFVIAAQRLGLTTIAVDRYPGAPAMQVADQSEVIDMLNGKDLEGVIQKHLPDFIVPEIEALRTEKLLELESKGFNVVPSAFAAHTTMNRDAIRNLAAFELKLRTAKFEYAESESTLMSASKRIGFPCVIKPVMSSSGKGQSVARKASDVSSSWKYAVEGMRGDTQRVIVEEFIAFESEITLLTVRQRKGPTLFVNPIGHRQERGDYRESWMPAQIKPSQLKQAQKMAEKVTRRLGGYGIFGVEFFLTKNEIYFSELSPRPHDTGMVTMISQNMNEFELHLRAILGLPIPRLTYFGPSASAVILGSKKLDSFSFSGLQKALRMSDTEIRLFGKPTVKAYRRMGVALSRGKSISQAKTKAVKASKLIRITSDGL